MTNPATGQTIDLFALVPGPASITASSPLGTFGATPMTSPSSSIFPGNGFTSFGSTSSSMFPGNGFR